MTERSNGNGSVNHVLATPDSAALLVSLVRNIPGAIYRCALDAEWTMHLIGDEIERITGYAAEDFIHNRRRTYGSVIHPEDRALVERSVGDAVESGRQFEHEYRGLTASGEQRWVLERGCVAAGAERAWLDGIIFDITARRRFEETARRAEAEAAVARELAEARKRVILAGDEARRRIERDLHDGAQQSFVCSMMTLGAARARLPHEPRAAAALLKATHEHLERGLRDLRDLARGVHPALLADHGVTAAIRALAARTPVPVIVTDGLQGRLAPEIEAALYFTAAEGVTNAAKHARASEIVVDLRHGPEAIVVEVSDDGVGGAAENGGGSGLRGLHDRLAAVGGSLDVATKRGAGTRLRARVPLPREAAES